MKPKTKVLTSVLLCGALVLAFTACAGCTGTDPIVGTYVNTLSSGKVVLDFHENGSFDTVGVYDDGYVTSLDLASWKKTGDNRYESGLIIFTLSDDGYTLTETLSDGDTEKFTKYSNYVIPEDTPKDSKLYKEHQMVGVWAMSVTDYTYAILTLKADKTATMTVSALGVSKSISGKWGYTETKDGIYDCYSLISTTTTDVAAIVHIEGRDTCAISVGGTDALTLTRVT